MSNFSLSSKSKQHREGVDPRLIEISDMAITLTKIDFGHGKYAGARPDEMQNDLFKRGKSKADGYKIRGKHQPAKDGYGKALDFYAYINGAASWQPEHLAIVACAFLQAASLLGHKIKWGGLWSSKKETNGIPYGWDMPHIQLVD